jgi:hypothetical protein
MQINNAVEKARDEDALALKNEVNRINFEAKEKQEKAVEDALRKKVLTIAIVDKVSDKVLKKLSISYDDFAESGGMLAEIGKIVDYIKIRKPLEQTILDNSLSKQDKNKLDRILESIGIEENDKGYIWNSYNHATLKIMIT